MVLRYLCRLSLVCTIGLICLSASQGEAAGSGDSEIRVGSWKGDRTSVEGVTVCFLYGPENKGVTLTAARTGQGNQFLGFYNNSWELRENATYDVVLTFDGGKRFSAKAESSGTEGVTIRMPIGGAIERTFRSAARLRLEAASESYTFSLRNSSNVLDHLSQCSGADHHSGQRPPPAEPAPKTEREPRPGLGPGRGPGRGPGFESKPEPELKSEAAPPAPYIPQDEVRAVAEQVTLGTFLTNVIWTAPQDATPETIRWQAQEVNGGVSILTYGGQSPTPEQAAQSLLTLATASCEGSFDGKTTPLKTLGIDLQEVSLRCQPLAPTDGTTAENTATVLYYVAPRPAGGVYAYRLSFKAAPPPNAEPLPGLYTALAVSALSTASKP